MARKKIQVSRDGVIQRLRLFPEDRSLFTASEAAAVIGVSERAITNWRLENRISPLVVGHRYFFTRSAILETAGGR